MKLVGNYIGNNRRDECKSVDMPKKVRGLKLSLYINLEVCLIGFVFVF